MPCLSRQTKRDGHPRSAWRDAGDDRRPRLWRKPVQPRTDALRQPGSSFKPYVYLTALMTGKFKPSTIVVDAPICLGNWCPHNYKNSYAGRLPLVEALARSLNTVAVRLSVAIGEADSVPGHNNIFEQPNAAAPRSSKRADDGTDHATARHGLLADWRRRSHGDRSCFGYCTSPMAACVHRLIRGGDYNSAAK